MYENLFHHQQSSHTKPWYPLDISKNVEGYIKSLYTNFNNSLPMSLLNKPFKCSYQGLNLVDHQKKEKKKLCKLQHLANPSTTSTQMEQRNTKWTIKFNMYGNNGAIKFTTKNYRNVKLGWDSLLGWKVKIVIIFCNLQN
jgi:hypothetical protein